MTRCLTEYEPSDHKLRLTLIESLGMKFGVIHNHRWMRMSDLGLPPRFGLITSNIAEAVNSMFDVARNTVWLNAVETMIEIMLRTRICKLRESYFQFNHSSLVFSSRNELHSLWEGTATMVVMERTEPESFIFQTTSSDDRALCHQRDGLYHIVKTGEKWCSCGIWQEKLFPCTKHAIAVFHHEFGFDETYISINPVHPYYKHGYLKKIFKKNIYPAVCLDTLACDGGATKSPCSILQPAGRPKKHTRIGCRSSFASDSDSNKTCSCSKTCYTHYVVNTCGQHNHWGTDWYAILMTWHEYTFYSSALQVYLGIYLYSRGLKVWNPLPPCMVVGRHCFLVYDGRFECPEFSWS